MIQANSKGWIKASIRNPRKNEKKLDKKGNII